MPIRIDPLTADTTVELTLAEGTLLVDGMAIAAAMTMLDAPEGDDAAVVAALVEATKKACLGPAPELTPDRWRVAALHIGAALDRLGNAPGPRQGSPRPMAPSLQSPAFRQAK